MKKIAFIDLKGGCGKSTGVTTISHMLAVVHKKRVLVVDLDPQGNSTSTFSENNLLEEFYSEEIPLLEYSVSTLLTDKTIDIHDCILHTKYEGLDVIGADLGLIQVERIINADTSTPQQIRLLKHLSKVEDEYDFCVFDCGPNAGLVNVNGLTAADEVYIPIFPDGYSLMAVRMTEELIENVSDFNVRIKIAGIYCGFYDNTKATKRVCEVMAERYPDLFLKDIVIPKTKYCKENTLFREPLLVLDSGKKKSKATQGYLNLTNYILAPNKKQFLKQLTEQEV